jgi:plastocyanin
MRCCRNSKAWEADVKKILGLSFMLCSFIWMTLACTHQSTTSGPVGSPTATPTATAVPVSGAGATVVYGGSLNFSPSQVTITHGQSVIWDSSLNGHTVTLDSFSGTTGSTGTNTASFPVTIVFPTAGTYYYHCGVSGHSGCGTTTYGVCTGGGGMFGSVVVN